MADFQAQLAALREAFAADLPARIEALHAAREADRDAGEATRTHFLAHRLAGSAGTFGYAALAQWARELERLLKAPAEEGRALVEEEAARVDRILQSLALLTPGAPEPTAPPAPTLPLIGFDPADPEDEALGRQLEALGYRVAPLLPGGPAPDALLLDADRPLPSAIAGLAAPRVFLSGHGGMASRLRAIRAGGQAFFARPTSASALADRLDALCARQPQDPYRVLVVDDDPQVAEGLALTLRRAGMLASSLADPLEILGALAETRPDLLLLDMHMPACTGKEVAAVIRQVEPLAGLPIVFLSGERDFARQMDAMGEGADDFLTKPIAPERLVAHVTHRAWRGRLLLGLMVRDGLTGLLNHSALLDQLDNEVARARRLDGRLVFAMADLDHFKRVNDTHGHGMGDQVLRAFSRLLQQRLRRTDALGRYGGEEFGIVLPDTELAEARALLEGLREDFAALRFHGPGGDFGVSFSAGLADFPAHGDGAGLCEAADRALYAAKAGGRNRVETAPTPGPSC
ncbi:diguanylate cyclase [Geothrix rubra]|uniref:diguanylate cyclase n=1 Tax=Geothrix rubra TaxID=2927977 RepID=A0ABQ5Q560_9BACT|nr:diguanylate cyclase [Geothrix rubra]GLH69895.1 diguanylate cyclase [Geothrix rubra]